MIDKILHWHCALILINVKGSKTQLLLGVFVAMVIETEAVKFQSLQVATLKEHAL